MVLTTLDALTTIFTPPASCSSHWTYEASNYNSIFGGLLIQNALAQYPNPDCLPPKYGDYGRVPGATAIYSPGACPSGYQVAANPQIGSVTTAICCLNQFTYYEIYSSQTSDTAYSSYRGCVSTYGPAASPTTVLGRTGYQLNTTVVSGLITMWAQPITIAYRAADLTLYTTSQPSSTSMPSITSQASTLAAPSVTQASTATDSTLATPITASVPGQGLSIGALAGIVVGAVIAFAVIIGLAIFFGLRQRRHRSTPEQLNLPASDEKLMATGPVEYQDNVTYRYELDPSPLRPTELPLKKHSPAELQ